MCLSSGSKTQQVWSKLVRPPVPERKCRMFEVPLVWDMPDGVDANAYAASGATCLLLEYFVVLLTAFT